MKQPKTSGLDADAAANSDHAAFPATHWSMLMAVRAGAGTEQRSVLNFLIQRYWKPVYCYVRRCGHGEEDAKDLVQEFFMACLRNDLFAKADPARGRFRNFLLRSLENFLHNKLREAQAQKRRPKGGFVSFDELLSDAGAIYVPQKEETPAEAYARAWILNLLQRVLNALEQECHATGKHTHFELFRQRIVAPALEGAQPPPLSELAPSYGLTEKEAANQLITARRAYQRLLREEIRLYATDDAEVAEEIQDIFRFLAGS